MISEISSTRMMAETSMLSTNCFNNKRSKGTINNNMLIIMTSPIDEQGYYHIRREPGKDISETVAGNTELNT